MKNLFFYFLLPLSMATRRWLFIGKYLEKTIIRKVKYVLGVSVDDFQTHWKSLIAIV